MKKLAFALWVGHYFRLELTDPSSDHLGSAGAHPYLSYMPYHLCFLLCSSTVPHVQFRIKSFSSFISIHAISYSFCFCIFIYMMLYCDSFYPMLCFVSFIYFLYQSLLIYRQDSLSISLLPENVWVTVLNHLAWFLATTSAAEQTVLHVFIVRDYCACFNNCLTWLL